MTKPREGPKASPSDRRERLDINSVEEDARSLRIVAWWMLGAAVVTFALAIAGAPGGWIWPGIWAVVGVVHWIRSSRMRQSVAERREAMEPPRIPPGY